MNEKKLLEWSIRSLSNVASIEEYIEADNPAAAHKVLGEIRKAAHCLTDFPMLGHTGQRAGTRELVLTKYPFTIIYRLTANKVFILAVAHQSKKHR